MFRHKVKPILGDCCAFLFSLISLEENFPSYRGNIGFTITEMSNRAGTHLVHLKLTWCMAEIIEKNNTLSPQIVAKSQAAIKQNFM